MKPEDIMITLYESASNKNILFHDITSGAMVQSNQHLIVSGGQGMLLDPGGHKVYTKLFSELAAVLPPNDLRYLFLSHQDPDIVAAVNGWLMVTEAEAYISQLWTRFVLHFGVDSMAEGRIKPIPDEGMVLELGDNALKIIPAHYLHSSGNFQVYDPASKILYTGDLGASLGHDYAIVPDFAAHVQYMQGFHQRYVPCSKPLKRWAAMARQLDIDTIAPQHGAIIQGHDQVAAFIDWCDNLVCGVDLVDGPIVVPG